MMRAGALRAGILGAVLFMATACGPPPPRTDFHPEAPVFPAGALEQVAEVAAPVGNLTVSPEGRVFFTFHPLASPDVKVAELLPDGTAKPWPDEAWQSRKGGFQTPLSVRLDTRGRLWVLDHGKNGFGTPALLAFDIATGKLAHRHNFTRAEAGRGSFLNDFSVDAEAGKIYIADTGSYNFNRALLVYDIGTNRARRLLEDDRSVREKPITMVVEGKSVRVLGLFPLWVGVDSIVLDLKSAYLYYGPMSDTRMYRVPVAALLDESLSPDALAAKVEDWAPKPLSDGITIDESGNVYVTAMEHNGVVVIGPDGKGVTLLRDDRLVWPDGFSFGPDGWVYLTDSYVNRILFKSKKKAIQAGSHTIYRFRGLAPGLPGR